MNKHSLLVLFNERHTNIGLDRWQVLDSAGELGWQLEREGLSGEGVGDPRQGDSGDRKSVV